MVLKRDEVRAVFNELHGEHWGLITVLMYGTGMRLLECYDCVLNTLTLALVKSSFARARASAHRLTAKDENGIGASLSASEADS